MVFFYKELESLKNDQTVESAQRPSVQTIDLREVLQNSKEYNPTFLQNKKISKVFNPFITIHRYITGTNHVKLCEIKNKCIDEFFFIFRSN
jgi:hypothetical protein